VSVLAETPAWAQVACEDLLSNKWAEIAGADDNPLIVSCWDYVDEAPAVHDDETSWCSAYMNRVVRLAGYQGTRKGNARSWLTWGAALPTYRVGGIAILWRESPQSWKGHVSILIGWTAASLLLLGGNQSDRITVGAFPRSQLLSLRWARAEDALTP
jgi:uncharacterized protein (TIGR02594 family)